MHFFIAVFFIFVFCLVFSIKNILEKSKSTVYCEYFNQCFAHYEVLLPLPGIVIILEHLLVLSAF